MKIQKQTNLQAINSIFRYVDDSTSKICADKIQQISEVNLVDLEDVEENLREVFEQSLDTIVVLKDKQLAQHIIQKYAEYNLKLVTQPSFGIDQFVAIFCCKSEVLKNAFEQIEEERRCFEKFLKEDGSVDEENFKWLVANYVKIYEEEDFSSVRVIFQNDVSVKFFISSKLFEDQNQVLLNNSQSASKFVHCEQILHDKISLYEFYHVLKDLIVQDSPVEDFCFVFPNDENEVEFYERFLNEFRN